MPETLEFDVVIVGAGPAGLSAAIQLAKLSKENPLSICVIEKGAEVGSQILSGAVIEPRALNELIPDWKLKEAPLNVSVTQDEFYLFTQKKALRLPTPSPMKNHGNYIISLGQFCKWLAKEAENLGVNIFPGFSGAEFLIENDCVKGIKTGDKGLDKEGKPTSRFQEGILLRAKQTVLAEGCRGSLTEWVIKKFNLRKDSDPQTYGLGIKELWEIPPDLHEKGKVMHSVGWPLDQSTYGGSFVYHFEKNLLAIGLVVGLDYKNPYLNIYEEFQKFKTHPKIAPLLKNSQRIAYGARALNEGGYQSIPKLSFPGGLIVGCAGGFLNISKIKGTHTAMKSGMIAAQTIFNQLENPEFSDFTNEIKKSWIGEELYSVRNIRPAFKFGLFLGLAYSAIDTYLFRGRAPWTFKNTEDYLHLKEKHKCKKINYPKHDHQITFDLATSVFLTHSYHDENQPCHLKLKNPETPITINYRLYASPETRYCPAGVYEVLEQSNGELKFHMNYTNCIQCKACDIKDPTQNILWTPPEGGSGPNYKLM